MQAALKYISECSTDEIKEFVTATEKRSFDLGTLQYCEGKIYKIVQLDVEDIIAYIGSTIQKLPVRWSGHKSFFKTCPNAGWTKYVLARGGVANFKIVLLEAYPCQTKKQLLEREAHYINLLNPICNIALRKATAEEIESRFKIRQDWRPANVTPLTLVTTPIVDSDFSKKLQLKMQTNAAITDDDQWKFYKRRYMDSWGLNIVDLDFISENGTDVSRGSTKMLFTYLFDIAIPDWERPKMEDVNYCHQVFRETLNAMTLYHPFAIESRVAAEDIQHKVLATNFFLNFKTTAKLFNSRAEHVEKWTNQRFCQVLNSIFNCYGLGVKSTSVRSNDIGRPRRYQYVIDNKKATRAAALINLYNKQKHSSKDQAVNAFLQLVGTDKYHKYTLQ